jgi:general secretion pathway protein I
MAGPDPRRGAAPAFTLLEVMVALTILAISLMALADLTGSALRNHAYARDLTVATLLARGKMAALEETYEDKGFTDFDESVEGDFADQGRPDFKWRVELKKPDSALSPDELLSGLLGASGSDAQDLMGKLLGTSGAKAGQAGGPQTASAGGLVGGMLQAQLTAFGEALKKSLREMRLTVGWMDGRQLRQFTVTTHLVVLNPKAPGGARGPDPDAPPNLKAPQSPQQLQQQLLQQQLQPGAAPFGFTPFGKKGKQ